MKNILCTFIFGSLALSISAQESVERPKTDEVIIQLSETGVNGETIAIIRDAINFPTKYNEYVQPYLKHKSFPIDVTDDNQLKKWIDENPELIKRLYKDREIAHEKLYGPRKKD